MWLYLFGLFPSLLASFDCICLFFLIISLETHFPMCLKLFYTKTLLPCDDVVSVFPIEGKLKPRHHLKRTVLLPPQVWWTCWLEWLLRWFSAISFLTIWMILFSVLIFIWSVHHFPHLVIDVFCLCIQDCLSLTPNKKQPPLEINTPPQTYINIAYFIARYLLCNCDCSSLLFLSLDLMHTIAIFCATVTVLLSFFSRCHTTSLSLFLAVLPMIYTEIDHVTMYL
jgi:hypothetical protein